MEQVEKKEHFFIDSLEKAGWAFKKLNEIEKQRQKLAEFAESEKKKVSEWFDNETEPLNRDKDYFEGLLKAYYIEQRIENPKAKVSTPWGKITSRKSQPKWEYDEDRITDWCRDNGFIKIETKESIKKAELKKYLEVGVEGHVYDPETGEVIEGIRVSEQDDVYKVELEE